MFSKQKQRSWIKIECTRGRTARQCHQGLQEACGESALPYRTVARWVKVLKEGRQNVADTRRPGRPALEPNDKARRKESAVNVLERKSEDETFLNRVCFSDEAAFHVSGKLNTHNVRIWRSENPHVTRELQRDSPKAHVCEIMCNRIIGPFFFDEPSVTANVCLDLLTEYVAPQLLVHDLQPTIIFQQDGAPPHWGLHVRGILNERFPTSALMETSVQLLYPVALPPGKD
ncbi:hypothetical protein B7P43_G03180 [Cryptotermes secundus]|uniref:Mos1 transposase HTH domain-containing protein n=1 Tax=Cryptotermes secundus TaxID=105785 RepID=A0A2J7RTJ8_9NEOP|nr:hypothetical protein B7P43_G03180 [Cryptotermes secundus]